MRVKNHAEHKKDEPSGNAPSTLVGGLGGNPATVSVVEPPKDGSELVSHQAKLDAKKEEEKQAKQAQRATNNPKVQHGKSNPGAAVHAAHIQQPQRHFEN